MTRPRLAFAFVTSHLLAIVVGAIPPPEQAKLAESRHTPLRFCGSVATYIAFLDPDTTSRLFRRDGK